MVQNPRPRPCHFVRVFDRFQGLGPKRVLAAIAAAARKVVEEIPERGIGLGVPGVVQPSEDAVAGSPNLSFLTGKPLASRVAEILGAPVRMGNDASLAAPTK